MNFATSNILVVKSTTFPQRKIYKYTWTQLDGNIYNHISHVLVDKRRQSSIIYFRPLIEANCEAGHYLLVATLPKRLSLNKGTKTAFGNR